MIFEPYLGWPANSYEWNVEIVLPKAKRAWNDKGIVGTCIDTILMEMILSICIYIYSKLLQIICFDLDIEVKLF